MHKFLFILSLLMFSLYSHAEEQENPDSHEHSMSLIYVGYGNKHLMNGEFFQGLHAFQQAEQFLIKSGQPCYEIEFLISFGKAIAYDNLNLKNECQGAIGALMYIFNANNRGQNGDKEPSFSSKEYEEADESLKELARLAASIDVREILLSMIDEMSSGLYTISDLPHSSYLGIQPYSENRLDLDKDVKFWKRARKLARKVYDAYIFAKKLLEFLNLIETTIKNAQNENTNTNSLSMYMDKFHGLWIPATSSPA